jgi:hypothetical protein
MSIISCLIWGCVTGIAIDLWLGSGPKLFHFSNIVANQSPAWTFILSPTHARNVQDLPTQAQVLLPNLRPCPKYKITLLVPLCQSRSAHGGSVSVGIHISMTRHSRAVGSFRHSKLWQNSNNLIFWEIISPVLYLMRLKHFWHQVMILVRYHCTVQRIKQMA